jgi:hypothetical protein
MDEAFLAACKKLVVFGGVAGFSMDDMLTLLLNGMTVDQLLDIIGKRMTAMGAATPPWTM